MQTQGTRQVTFHRRPNLLSCIAALTCAAFAATGAETDEAWKQQVSAIQEDLAGTRTVLYALVGDTVTNGPVTVVRCSIPDLIERKPLTTEFLVAHGEVVGAMAWTVGYASGCFALDEQGLNAGTGTENGSLRGNLQVVFTPTSGGGVSETPTTISMSMDATWKAGVLDGTYTVTGGLPKRTGSLKGSTRRAGSQGPDVVTTPATAGASLYDLYTLAVSAETEALGLYKRALALDLYVRGQEPLRKVMAQVPFRIPRRPAFKPKPAAQGKGKPANTAPDLDAMGTDLGLDAHTPSVSPAKPAPADGGAGDPASAQRFRTLVAIRDHIGRIRAAMATRRADGPANPVTQSEVFGDPDFGPWFGFEPLRSTRDCTNALPSGAGHDGVQHWPHVAHWRFIGPFPRDGAGLSVSMPEVFDTVDADYGIDSGRFAAKYAGPSLTAWTARDVVEPGIGMFRPPQWVPQRVGFNFALAGLADSCIYAAANVSAEEDAELWVGMHVDDFGKFWFNGRLAATWLVPPPAEAEQNVRVFRLKFRKGINQLVVRLDKTELNTGFWVRICVQGRPRDAATARAAVEHRQKRQSELKHVPPNVRGWRGDWAGNFAEATPVTAWDIEKNINVRWRTPLAKTSSTPVIAGDRIFTLYERNNLVCLDKMSGKILWEREMNVLDLMEPELYEESQKKRGIWLAYRDQLAAMGPDWGGQLSALIAKGKSKEDAEKELVEMYRQGDRLYADYWAYLSTNGKTMPRSTWRDWLGLSFATPVTDGKHVWVKSAASVTACYDMDGNRKWMVRTEYPDNGMQVCSSPVLTGNPYDGTGRLIMELASAKPTIYDTPPMKLVGLDAMTGKTVWEVEVRNAAPSDSPIPMRLTDGSDEIEVVVNGGGGHTTSFKARGAVDAQSEEEGGVGDFYNGGGTVVRAVDGKVLIRDMGLDSGWSSPLAAGNRVFHFSSAQSTGIEMIMVDRDHVGAKRLWTRRAVDFDGGLVHHNGVLHGQAGGQWFCGYRMYDATTGAAVARQVNVGWGFNGGRAYVPPAVAGDLLFIGDHGSFLAGPKQQPKFAKMTVLQSGPRGRIIARNQLEKPITPSPVFDGDRTYYRSEDSLMCIAYTNEEGRAFEAEVNAREVLSDFATRPPAATVAHAIAPTWRQQPDLPTQPVHEFVLAPICMAGPLPADGADEIMTAMGGPAKTILRANQGLTCKGESVRVVGQDRSDRINDLLKPLHGRANTSALFFTVIENRTKWTARVHQRMACAEVWIGGQKVSDQDRIDLEPGWYPVLVKMRFDDKPPERAGLTMFFVESTDNADIKGWFADRERNKGIFDRLLKYRPDGDLAATVKSIRNAVSD